MACVAIEMRVLGEEELEVREKQRGSLKNILYKDIEVVNL